MLDIKKIFIVLSILLILNMTLRILNNNKSVEGFSSLYEVRRGSIGYTGEQISNTSGKWIKVASVNMDNTYEHKALTLEIYPKRLGHGVSRERHSIMLRNNDKSGMQPLIYSSILYGDESAASFKDIAVVRENDNLQNVNDIFLQIGSSWLTSVPCSWHLENINESDLIMVEDNTDMFNELPAGKQYRNVINVDSSSKLRGEINDLRSQVANLNSKINNVNNDLGKKIKRRVRYRDTIHIKGSSNNYLQDQHGRDHYLAKFQDKSGWFYHQLKIVPFQNNDAYLSI